MKHKIWEFLLVLLGNFFLAMSVKFFIIPYSILSGGVAGISVAIYPLIHLPEELMLTVLTVSLFLLGTVFLGKSFAVKTVISTIAYPGFVYLLNFVPAAIEVDPILASIYSGILAGIGVGLAFKADASTGGMDIPPLIIHKLTNIPLATLVMVTDALTVLLGLSTYGINSVLLGLISVYTSGITIDKIMTLGTSKAKQVTVISQYSMQISSRVMKEMERGVTVLDGKGGYTRERKEVLMIVVPSKEYQALLNIIEECDKDAFVVINDTHEIRGEGFSYFRI